MKTISAIMLGREDMIPKKTGKDILLIDFGDFKISEKPIRENDLIIFVDDNGLTKILKNRYGDKGEGVFVNTLENMKLNSEMNNLGYGSGYFDDIISLYRK